MFHLEGLRTDDSMLIKEDSILFESLPQELLCTILSYLSNKKVINEISRIIDFNEEMLFSFKYPSFYEIIKKLLNERIIPHKYKNCFLILYEDLEKLDFSIIERILKGEQLDYNIEDKKLIISSVTYDILYTAFLHINSGLIQLDKYNDEISKSPYNSMYIYNFNIEAMKFENNKIKDSNIRPSESFALKTMLHLFYSLKMSENCSTNNEIDDIKIYIKNTLLENSFINEIYKDSIHLDKENNYYIKMFNLIKNV